MSTSKQAAKTPQNDGENQNADARERIRPRPASKIDGTRPAALVAEFHALYGMPDRIAQELPSNLNYDRIHMRMGLIAEELVELFAAVYGQDAARIVSEAIENAPDQEERDVVETADALADLIYVIYGMALESGIDLDAVLAEVHSSNLSKLMPDGSVRRREDGKILKGPGFREPDIAEVIARRDAQVTEEVPAVNPLMSPSKLPFGVPDFEQIRFEHLEPALMEGLAQEKADWHRIATNPEVPDVDNTVAAVDRAGDLLDRAVMVFGTLSSSIGGPELDALQEKLAPLFAAHTDDFYTNKRLYDRYKKVAEAEDLDAETRWLVDETIRDFERSGVNLPEKAKKRLRKLNAKIAELEARIDTRITNQLIETALYGDSLEELAGLSEEEITAAHEAGKAEGREWKLSVSNFSIPTQLASLTNAETRQKLLEVSLQRGSTGNLETDTRDLIIELAKRRDKRAQLLGFNSHADIVMDEETVPSPKEARSLLRRVGEAARDALEKEAGEYRKVAPDGTLTVADWPLLEERARKDSLGVDSEELKQYLELNKVVEDGVFYAANRLYGLTFTKRNDIVGWAPEVQTWEVEDEDGRVVGLFMADYFKRPGKSGGAWMSLLEPGCKRTGHLPVITNDCNFDKAPEGQPVLLSWDNVETLFHEFGHALHGLLTQTYYEETAGANVPRDFVELPSQLNEMWAFHPEVLGNYARHWETGEPLPAEVQEALVNSKHFGQPYSTLEYVQAALIDQAWHDGTAELPRDLDDVDTFEAEALEAAGVAHELVAPRYRSPYFAHAFTGGYDAAYYSYMWAEAMVGELEEWLRNEAAKEDGGLNREAGNILRKELLSRGNSRPPMESFVAVRGHMPDGGAVTRRRGLTS